jgi:hypothetical protein
MYNTEEKKEDSNRIQEVGEHELPSIFDMDMNSYNVGSSNEKVEQYDHKKNENNINEHHLNENR